MELSPKLLKKMILEEAKKMNFAAAKEAEKVAKETDEVDADELADTLEKKIDYVKALKLEESRLKRRLQKISEQKRKVQNSVKE